MDFLFDQDNEDEGADGITTLLVITLLLAHGIDNQENPDISNRPKALNAWLPVPVFEEEDEHILDISYDQPIGSTTVETYCL
jgi:hypothetical protein